MFNYQIFINQSQNFLNSGDQSFWIPSENLVDCANFIYDNLTSTGSKLLKPAKSPITHSAYPVFVSWTLTDFTTISCSPFSQSLFSLRYLIMK